MGRIILAVFAGILAGGFCTGMIQAISFSQHPVPEGMEPGSEAFRTYLASLPTSAFLIIQLGYCVGSLVGGYLATRISPANAPRNALVVGCVMLVFGVRNLLAIPHPAWNWVATLFVFIPPALLGGRFAIRRQPSQSPA